jgi:hypothetical protein
MTENERMKLIEKFVVFVMCMFVVTVGEPGLFADGAGVLILFRLIDIKYERQQNNE